MKLQVVEPGQGAVWVRRSFEVFRVQPLGFVSVPVAYLLLSLVLGVVPWIGSIAALALGPTFQLVFMIASRRASEGHGAMPGAIVELMSAGRARLLGLFYLGVAYVIAIIVLFWLANVLDNGAFASVNAALGSAKTTPEFEAALIRAADPRVQRGVILNLAAVGVLSMTFWHAPALVYWGAQPWARSIVFSWVALWRNKGAFAIYGLVWAALWMLLVAVISICAGVLGQLGGFIAVPLIFVFLVVFFASLWFTFAGCFSPSDPVAAVRGDDVDPPDPPTKGSS